MGIIFPRMEQLLLQHNMAQFTNIMTLKIILKVNDLQQYLKVLGT